MLVGFGGLEGKAIGEVGSSDIQAFQVEGEKGRLVGGVVVGQDDGQGLLLDHLNLPTLVLSQATVKHWCCKLKSGPDSCLVDCEELLGCATQGLKPDEDPDPVNPVGSHEAKIKSHPGKSINIVKNLTFFW